MPFCFACWHFIAYPQYLHEVAPHYTPYWFAHKIIINESTYHFMVCYIYATYLGKLLDKRTPSWGSVSDTAKLSTHFFTTIRLDYVSINLELKQMCVHMINHRGIFVGMVVIHTALDFDPSIHSDTVQLCKLAPLGIITIGGIQRTLLNQPNLKITLMYSLNNIGITSGSIARELRN